jgi:hypothetical protein
VRQHDGKPVPPTLSLQSLVVLGENRKSDTVAGLNDFVASLEGVQTVSAYCGRNLEQMTIRGYPKDHGPVTKRDFLLRYSDK